MLFPFYTKIICQNLHNTKYTQTHFQKEQNSSKKSEVYIPYLKCPQNSNHGDGSNYTTKNYITILKHKNPKNNPNHIKPQVQSLHHNQNSTQSKVRVEIPNHQHM